jgi:hypothetical protein
MQEGRLDVGTINMCNAAIRFFFAVTLNKTLNYLQLPRFKKRKTPALQKAVFWQI